MFKPTPEEILAAKDKTVPDVIGPDLKVLFCGINPGLYTAAVGHHFARPGNRFWPALYGAGFTDRILSPFEERELLATGYGITNLVDRATRAADEIPVRELIDGRNRLEAKVGRCRPRAVAFLGIQAYRLAFNRPKAAVGRQGEMIRQSIVWVLPNPSGLNAHYSLKDLISRLQELRREVG